MAKAELGTKRACPSCGARFYDLNKSPAECPECQTVFNPEEFVRGRRSRTSPAAETTPKAAPKAKAKAKAPVAEEAEEDTEDVDELPEVEVDDLDNEDEDEDVIEDASDLGEDDDVSDVIRKGDKDDDA